MVKIFYTMVKFQISIKYSELSARKLAFRLIKIFLRNFVAPKYFYKPGASHMGYSRTCTLLMPYCWGVGETLEFSFENQGVSLWHIKGKFRGVGLFQKPPYGTNKNEMKNAYMYLVDYN